MENLPFDLVKGQVRDQHSKFDVTLDLRHSYANFHPAMSNYSGVIVNAETDGPTKRSHNVFCGTLNKPT